MTNTPPHKPNPSIDEAFLPLANFVEETANLEGEIKDPAAGVAMTIETVQMSLPIEIDISVDESGKVAIGAVPPMYSLETSVLPIFHQIDLTLELAMPEKEID